MKKFQISFLINPVSGDGMGLKVKSQIPEIMHSFGYSDSDWNLELTKKDRLEDQTREILGSSLKVIAVGGDGTMGLVLNQLRRSHYKETQVGLIPMGTGNDLGRILGIYGVYKDRGLLACIKRLIRASSTEFNLWNINNSYTLSAYISFGMDAAILKDVDEARKKSGFRGNTVTNKTLFLKNFLNRSGYRIKPNTTLTFSTGGRQNSLELGGNCSCIIANINSYAGGSRPSREIKFDDGQLNILVFRNSAAFFLHMISTRLLASAPAVLGPLVEVHQADSVEIFPDGKEFFQLDGESFPLEGMGNSLHITPGHQVSLLDLRKAPFAIF